MNKFLFFFPILFIFFLTQCAGDITLSSEKMVSGTVKEKISQTETANINDALISLYEVNTTTGALGTSSYKDTQTDIYGQFSIGVNTQSQYEWQIHANGFLNTYANIYNISSLNSSITIFLDRSLPSDFKSSNQALIYIYNTEGNFSATDSVYIGTTNIFDSSFTTCNFLKIYGRSSGGNDKTNCVIDYEYTITGSSAFTEIKWVSGTSNKSIKVNVYALKPTIVFFP